MEILIYILIIGWVLMSLKRTRRRKLSTWINMIFGK